MEGHLETALRFRPPTLTTYLSHIEDSLSRLPGGGSPTALMGLT